MNILLLPFLYAKVFFKGTASAPICSTCVSIPLYILVDKRNKQFGFPPHDENDRLYNPIHWFQFADNVAVVTKDERENKLLLNCFTNWCQWSMMKIRANKCVASGLKKFSTRSIQFRPRKSFLLSNLGSHLDIKAAILISRWMIKIIRSKYNLVF